MTSEVNSKVVFVLVYLKSDLPTPDRGKSADSWKKNKNKQKQTKTKKSGDSTKSSEILFFSPEQDWTNFFSIGGINCLFKHYFDSFVVLS